MVSDQVKLKFFVFILSSVGENKSVNYCEKMMSGSLFHIFLGSEQLYVFSIYGVWGVPLE